LATEVRASFDTADEEAPRGEYGHAMVTELPVKGQVSDMLAIPVTDREGAQQVLIGDSNAGPTTSPS
jgi:hypothetical protein